MKIYYNYNIKNESTFKIGGEVKEVAFPDSIEELIDIADNYDLILGNCSNVLFCSEKIDDKIIITKNINKYKIINNKIIVECGVKGPIIANEAAKNGLSGFEFLSGFPGSFGGMIYMNASAHNQSIADTFIKCRVYDKKSKSIITLDKKQINFQYRNSILKSDKYILLDAEFELNNGNIDEINKLMAQNISFRKEKQPSLKYGNAGSIFRNPENNSAGKLLDLCGFKGEIEGGAKVFDNHANFIINYNNATSKDVLTLMYKMYSKVLEEYKIKLRPEIKYIGDRKTKEYKLWETMTENI